MKCKRLKLRVTFVLITILAFSSLAIGQQSNSEKIDKDSIYCMSVDKHPEFPGGQFALSTFMYKNLKYPQKAIIERSEGIVRVDFVVNKTGEISDLKVTSKGTSTELNNEVLRVMRLLPHFEPAVNKGKKVSYKVWGESINFQLKPCTKKEFYPIIITPIDCGLPTFSPDAKGVYTFVEKMPEYPGGLSELFTFISNNLPHNQAGDDGIQGSVLIKFTISKTGKVKDIVVLRSLNPTCDKDAVRVIKLFPDWIPGEHNGKKVDVYYTLPVKFRLE